MLYLQVGWQLDGSSPGWIISTDMSIYVKKKKKKICGNKNVKVYALKKRKVLKWIISPKVHCDKTQPITNGYFYKSIWIGNLQWEKIFLKEALSNFITQMHCKDTFKGTIIVISFPGFFLMSMAHQCWQTASKIHTLGLGALPKDTWIETDDWLAKPCDYNDQRAPFLSLTTLFSSCYVL